MTKPAPTYRYRGNVCPSAEVKRPVAAHRNAASTGSGGSSTGSSATIDIFDVIDSWGGWWGISAAEVDAALKQIGDVDALFVRINSPGGEATEGVAIGNLLRAHKATVRVTNYGLAASAASLIATAGDVLSMGPGSLLMIHDAWDIALGDANEMRQTATVLDAISDSYAGLYAAKAGGSSDEWRTVMQATTWYSAQAAVTAKLADRVGLDPALPSNLPPVEDDTDDDATVIQLDIEISQAALAAARRFDMSMLPNAPAALAPTQAPADQPVTPPTQHKEADTMSDIPTAGLVKALGLPDDADEDTILEAVEAQITAAASAAKAPPAPAAAVPDGHVLMSKDALDELRIAATAGQEARAVQLRADRDETISAAIRAGKIAPARKDHWTNQWDKDAEGTKASLASLEAVYPVAALPGHAGGDNAASTAAFSDDEAGVLAALAGVSKEGLLA